MNNNKIKVIKKRDLIVKKKLNTKLQPTKKESATAIVSNVSSWVNDFQKRKREETKHAFETLLSSHPESVSS